MPGKVVDATNTVAKEKIKSLLAWNFIVFGETGNTQGNNEMKKKMNLGNENCFASKKTGIWAGQRRGLQVRKVRKDGIWACVLKSL